MKTMTCGLYANEDETEVVFVWKVQKRGRGSVLFFFIVTAPPKTMAKGGALIQTDFCEQYPRRVRTEEV